MTDSLVPSSLPPLSSSPTPSLSSNNSAASTRSSIGSLNTSRLETDFIARAYDYPPTPPPESPELPLVQLPSSSVPRAIPEARHLQETGASGLATPPLTPDDGSEDGEGSLSALGAKQSAFLSMLFPRNALGAVPYAQSVSISTPGTGPTFDGVVLSLPGTPKTFYVDGKCAATVSLRERYVHP